MTEWQVAGYVGWFGLMIATFPHEFWPKFQKDKTYQHWVMASVVALFFLWSLRAGLAVGLQVHFLLLTVLTLCHGWKIACLVGAIPVLLQMIFGLLPVADGGLYGLTGVMLPVIFSYVFFLLIYRFFTRHLFIYIFLAAFINSALTMAVHMLLTSGWIWGVGEYSWTYIVENYLVLMPLLLFPEGLLNGMAITLLVVYRPEWVRTFHDSDYIDGK
ncbi:energy-coupling factor ABC transporter permease [Photobacterium minamisatsumaniensis]|uniref:energy-coupling factor ABC transporter permease n=1 Tax=Photobacterium minamisatsumaniensis TaxID=2910233 RepID=UPI003D0F786D